MLPPLTSSWGGVYPPGTLHTPLTDPAKDHECRHESILPLTSMTFILPSAILLLVGLDEYHPTHRTQEGFLYILCDGGHSTIRMGVKSESE